jgi:Restriction endonuclease HincII
MRQNVFFGIDSFLENTKQISIESERINPNELLGIAILNYFKEKNPNFSFLQHEVISDLFSRKPLKISADTRLKILNTPAVSFFLGIIKNWSPESPFDEKQNDTADILLVRDGFYEIIDVKTRNTSKSAQPPNIISAYKLAQLCANMIDNQEFDNFSLNYVEIDWTLENQFLVCENAHSAALFSANPATLYINWAAAMQIQFHVCDLDQSFQESRAIWAKEYLRHFTAEARNRANYMIRKFAIPFEKYLV